MVGFSAVQVHHDPGLFKHEPLAMLCYFMMGCGFLTGWNAFLTATDFFNMVFPGRSIDRVFTCVYLPITLCLVGLVSRFPSILWNSRTRILTGYTLFTLSTAVIPLIDACLIRGQQRPPEAAYVLVLLAVALIAAGDGVSQGTVYGDAALLPGKYTQATVMGAAASGVVIGVIRIVTKGSLPQTPEGLRTSTQIYFALSAAITAVCLALYELVMPRLDVIKHYRGKLTAERDLADLAARRFSEASGSPASQESFINISVTGERLQVVRSSSSTPAVGRLTRRQGSSTATPKATSPAAPTTLSKDIEANSTAEATEPTRLCSAANSLGESKSDVINRKIPSPLVPSTLDVLGTNADTLTSVLHHHPGANNSKTKDADTGRGHGDEEFEELGPLSWTSILKLNWRLCVGVFVVYAVTLSIFPGFLAENVHSTVLKDWYPVLLIFTFNIFDFLGRCTPHFGWAPSQTTLLVLSLVRLVILQVLFPIFSVKGAGEAVFFILTFLLGLSNGYLTALIFCAAPRGLSPSAAELAGNVNVFCELSGLFFGAFLGWLWTTGK